MNKNKPWGLWSSKLSPYGIKVDALLRQAGLDFSWLPEEGDRLQSLRQLRRLLRVKRGRDTLTWPPAHHLQELPAVPYLFGPSGELLYDSSAIAEWLQQQNTSLTLLPAANTAEGFITRLIDEALDEFGLYMVHHNRWVHAAADNSAGQILAAEMRPLLGPLNQIIRRTFPRRQTRRLPYLFSVASEGSSLPSRTGFPPTHELLDRAFTELLAALEVIFSQQRYLLGNTMTLADASILGQLGMNKADPSVWEAITAQAPNTASWITANHLCTADNNHNLNTTEQPLLTQYIQPLISWICRYFIPLMQQNYRAYQHCSDMGESLFNEAAFNKNRALYLGELAGSPFKSVVKSFQVVVWEKLHQHWLRLPVTEKEKLALLMPAQHGLESLRGKHEITI
ncbi:MAG: hypothetical protein ACSHWQ_09415 [Spongiibacteraceae bacterium]